MKFIQTVLHAGSLEETYVKTRVHLYKTQKKKQSMTLPPDPSSCKQAVLRAQYQGYIWLRCHEMEIEPISYQDNGWAWNENTGLVSPVWFTGPQLPPSLRPSRKRGRKGIPSRNEGYEADEEQL